MAYEIKVPRLGWSMDEGVFVEWLKQEGDAVQPGDPLFMLEGEKAVQEIEAIDGGTLRIPDGPTEGQTVPVGAVLGYLVGPEEDVPSAAADTGSAPSTPATKTSASAAPSAGPAIRKLAQQLGVNLQQVNGTGPRGRITREDVENHNSKPAPMARRNRQAISPRAARAARNLNVDVSVLTGSGRNGRIREKDVLAAAATHSPRAAGTSNVRQTIARRLQTSQSETVAVTLNATADATNLVNLRAQFKATAESRAGRTPTFNDIFIKLTAVALSQHPDVNSQWKDGPVELDGIHIGLAVDTNSGLIVPVVRDVPQLTLGQVAETTAELVAAAQSGQLRASDLQGGTFTISNLGQFGVDAFTPVINYPECAILGIGRIAQQPAVEGNQILAKPQVVLSLTFDHRIIDGAPAARFLQTVRECIENPSPWLLA